MSTERDIERILDAWLAPGPNEMPDRLYHDAIDRIERTPQRRAAWPRRFPTMFSMSKLPLAAAVAALAIGLATVGLWQGRDGSGPADQAPAATAPSPSPSLDAGSFVDGAPEALRGSWSAAPRGDIPGLFLSKSIAGWAIDSSFHTNFQDSSLGSRVITTGPDTFRLENVFGGQGCPQGSVGDYSWTLGDHGASVTIGALSDDCAARAYYLNGTWSRTSCDLGWSCLGRLEPGRHESAIFDPRADAEPRVARPGAVSYEVPAGWVNADDWHSNLMLVPESGYERLLEDPGIWPDQVRIWSTPVTALTVPGPDCTQWLADPAGGSTVESLAAWLEGHPDLDVRARRPITIDGHPGLVIDTEMAINDNTAALTSSTLARACRCSATARMSVMTGCSSPTGSSAAGTSAAVVSAQTARAIHSASSCSILTASPWSSSSTPRSPRTRPPSSSRPCLSWSPSGSPSRERLD